MTRFNLFIEIWNKHEIANMHDLCYLYLKNILHKTPSVEETLIN